MQEISKPNKPCNMFTQELIRRIFIARLDFFRSNLMHQSYIIQSIEPRKAGVALLLSETDLAMPVL